MRFTREDEFNGGYVPANNTITGTRKRQRLAGGVRDKLTMGMQKAYIAALWRDGQSYANIAASVNQEFNLEGDEQITPYAINYHVKQMIDYWRQKGLVAVDEKQAMVLARYEQLEMIITDAYYASCRGRSTRNFEKQTQRVKSNGNRDAIIAKIKKDHDKLSAKGKKIKTNDDGTLEDLMELTQERIKKYRRIEENEGGDPRFLSLLIDINHKRAQLWGLLTKSEMTNADQELARMPDSDREARIASLINSAQKRHKGIESDLAEPAPLGGFQEEVDDEEQIDIDNEPGWEDTDPDKTVDGVEVDFD